MAPTVLIDWGLALPFCELDVRKLGDLTFDSSEMSGRFFSHFFNRFRSFDDEIITRSSIGNLIFIMGNQVRRENFETFNFSCWESAFSAGKTFLYIQNEALRRQTKSNVLSL